MPHENVEIVRLVYEAWNRDDFDAALVLIHPDAEWHGPGDLFLGIEPLYRGHAGVREWRNAAKEPWEYFKSHVERTLDEGNKVVTVVRFEAVGKESGVKVELLELPLVNVCELAGGLIVRFCATTRSKRPSTRKGCGSRRGEVRQARRRLRFPA